MHLVFAFGDDWDGMYIDGTLRDQGHSLDLLRVVALIQAENRLIEIFDYAHLGEKALEVLHTRGEYPESFDDLAKWLEMDEETE